MMRWRLIFEEYHPKVVHSAGVDNNAAGVNLEGTLIDLEELDLLDEYLAAVSYACNYIIISISSVAWTLTRSIELISINFN